MAEATTDQGVDIASQARDALRNLGPLLRRRGTSVEVGRRLRRAIQHLDKALSGPEVASSEIRSAVVELGACAHAIRGSERKGDQDQLAGVNTALAALENLRSARTGTLLSTPGRPIVGDLPVAENVSAVAPLAGEELSPPPFATPSFFKDRVSEPNPVLPPRAEITDATSIAPPPVRIVGMPALAEPTDHRSTKTATGHGASVATVSNLCSRISALHRRRLTCLDDTGATWNYLAGLERELARCALALSWAVDSSPAGVEEFGEMTSRAEPIETVIALLHLGGPVAIAMALGAARESCRDGPSARLLVDAFRVGASDSLLQKARELFASPGNESFRAPLVPFLAERGALSPEDLIGIVRDERDDAAAAATYAIGRLGRREHAKEIFAIRASLLRDGSNRDTTERGDALAFASVVLGERAALDEVRQRIESDPKAGASVVDALAIAGAESDAERLLQFAEHGGPEATRATLAAGHLGAAGILPRLEALKAAVGEDLVDQAKRAIVGDSAPYPSGSVRLLRGCPWTVEGALERLADPGELILSQEWIALELSVRTGVRVPRPLLLGAPTKETTEIAAAWQNALRQARLPRGSDWLYFGRPLRSPA